MKNEGTKSIRKKGFNEEKETKQNKICVEVYQGKKNIVNGFIKTLSPKLNQLV